MVLGNGCCFVNNVHCEVLAPFNMFCITFEINFSTVHEERFPKAENGKVVENQDAASKHT